MGFIADIFTADKAADAQKDAARDAAKASQYATDKTIGLQKEIFDKIWTGTQVQRDAGDAATRLMAQIMGLQLPASTPTVPQPQTIPASARTYPGLEGRQGAYAGINGLPANALNPTGPFVPTQQPAPSNPAQPFDVTAWLRSTPGYEANFKEGARALNAGLASSGRLFSGDAGREAIRYGQQYADRIYGDQWNRLAGIAGAGQTATSQGGQAGQNYANQSGNALQNNAQNLASSYQNRGNAISGFWGSAGGSLGGIGDAYSAYKKGGWAGALGSMF